MKVTHVGVIENERARICVRVCSCVLAGVCEHQSLCVSASEAKIHVIKCIASNILD